MSIYMLNTSSITSSPAAQHHEPSPSERKWKVEPPSADEMKEFYKSLSECSIKPVCPSLIHPYSNLFIFSTRNIKAVPNFYYKKYLELSYPDLLKECYKNDLKLLDEQLKAIERDTANQAKQSPFFKELGGKVLQNAVQQATQIHHGHHNLSSKPYVIQICFTSQQQPLNMVINMRHKLLQHTRKPWKRFMQTLLSLNVAQVLVRSVHFLRATLDFFMWTQLLWTGLWKGEVPLLHWGAWLW